MNKKLIRWATCFVLTILAGFARCERINPFSTPSPPPGSASASRVAPSGTTSPSFSGTKSPSATSGEENSIRIRNGVLRARLSIQGQDVVFRLADGFDIPLLSNDGELNRERLAEWLETFDQHGGFREVDLGVDPEVPQDSMRHFEVFLENLGKRVRITKR